MENTLSFVENLKQKTIAMSYETYQLETTDSVMIFEFISEGPKGFIKKRIQYQNIGEDIYNLAFGDVDEVTNEFDDTIVSDNNDVRKILATVALTITFFLNEHPTAFVHIKGGTIARNRLYKMAISNNFEEISDNFMVLGFTEDKNWALYEKNNNYSAFLIIKNK